MPIAVTRTEHRLSPDASRVLAKPYLPGEEVILPGASRAQQLLARIVAIPEAQVRSLLDDVLEGFASRHRGFEEILESRFRAMAHELDSTAQISRERRLLIGAYFTHEYSVEAAALFNPSLVLAPDQTGLSAGEQRLIMSLRAVGEGHISSIEFRTGIIGNDGKLHLDEPGPYLVGGDRTPPDHYCKQVFAAKLNELGAANDLAWRVLDQLAEHFTLKDLDRALDGFGQHDPPQTIWLETVKIIRVLATSNYVTTFPADSQPAERVIFPAGPNETRGMEDARFVRFVDTDGSIRYYATYTAFDGFQILPQLIETNDFVTFTISTLNGSAAQNKGMALFPRRVNGEYLMLSRKDRENLYLASSSDVHFWHEARELYKPAAAWELLHIGNCGSPLETEAGWLVITHGVGAMRRYALGALLLDLDDPGKVIGHLSEPLLEPNASEREGYVPNVLYTCGGIISNGQLLLPYGFADSGVSIVSISVVDLLAELCGPAACT
jgi:predicted GH43/DUF377 family glycosyl hydrolase